jgi:hypothetical protein
MPQSKSSRGDFLTILTVYDRIVDRCLLTDGSFVDCDSFEDVESGGQSIVDEIGRSKKRGLKFINFRETSVRKFA